MKQNTHTICTHSQATLPNITHSHTHTCLISHTLFLLPLHPHPQSPIWPPISFLKYGQVNFVFLYLWLASCCITWFWCRRYRHTKNSHLPSHHPPTRPHPTHNCIPTSIPIPYLNNHLPVFLDMDKKALYFLYMWLASYYIKWFWWIEKFNTYK